MNKQDITKYSDDELSLIVMNDETFYKMRRRMQNEKDATNLLSEYFVFTNEQLKVLIEDVDFDLNS